MASLSSLPPPYCDEASHNTSLGFNGSVRQACANNTMPTQIFGGKIIVLGDSAVGKTSLIRRFVSHTFERDYKATIGVDFEVQTFHFLHKQFDMRVWDTAGNDRFKAIVSAYYRGSNAIILVFDASKPAETLGNTRQWLEEAMEKKPAEDCLVFLVASKKDLLTASGVETMEAGAVVMAKELKAEFWSVSAKSGENVSNLFTRVAALCFDQAASAVIQSDGADASSSAVVQIGRDKGNLIRLQQSPAEEKRVGHRQSCCSG